MSLYYGGIDPSVTAVEGFVCFGGMLVARYPLLAWTLFLRGYFRLLLLLLLLILLCHLLYLL